jgi:hypothetical protein
MRSFERLVLRTILYNPDNFHQLLKTYSDHAAVFGVIKKYFPYDIGLEIEAFDDKTYKNNIEAQKEFLMIKENVFFTTTSPSIRRKNRIRRYHQRVGQYPHFSIQDSYMSKFYREIAYDRVAEIDRQSNGEYTARLYMNHTATKALVILNGLLKYMKKYCPFNKKSGIHIHVDSRDMEEYGIFDRGFRKNRFNKKFLFEIPESKYSFPKKYLDDAVIKIFNYKGEYNRKQVSVSKAAIRFHSKYNTIEYRMARMTYKFNVIVRWILAVQYMTKCYKHKVRTGDDIYSSEKLLEILDL